MSKESDSVSSAVALLTAAAETVGGPRNDTHGDKLRNMSHTANLMNAYLGDKLRAPLTAQDVAMLMIAVKQSRIRCGVPIRDHFLDIAGYAAVAYEVGNES